MLLRGRLLGANSSSIDSVRSYGQFVGISESDRDEVGSGTEVLSEYIVEWEVVFLIVFVVVDAERLVEFMVECIFDIFEEQNCESGNEDC